MPNVRFLVIRKAITLIERHDDRRPGFEGVLQNVQVLIHDSFLAIEDKYSNMRTGHSIERFNDTEFFNNFTDFTLAPNTRRIDQHIISAIAVKRNIYRISSRAGQIKYNLPLLTEQAVNKRRLAYVGSPDDGDPT